MTNYYSSRLKNEKRRKKRRRIAGIIVLILLIGGGTAAFLGYRMIYQPNIWLNGAPSFSLNIKSTDTWEDVQAKLYKNGTIINRVRFEQLAKLMKYPGNIKPGHYSITEGMSNYKLISKLRAGNQDPVDLIFNNVRTKEDLAGKLGEQLETDSVSLINLFNDSQYLDSLGFTPATVITLFIPNTYSVYWNIKPRKLMERMKKEYSNFWNESREAKLKEIRLTRLQVMTLASIVEKETNMDSEKPDVAGVYMNRLRQGWLLQADPTLVFALGDFSIKRVLNIYKKIDSPYNTYMYIGLPPGPICLPSISSIDAVLNFRQHNYFYFCAREDFSGYHNFAATLQEHDLNAARYQQALNARGITK